MRFTVEWLKTCLDTDASLEEIVETLTMIGLEVEEVIDHSAALKPFQIAQIIEAEPHPNADKLRVCKVNTGNETLQIVCGAPNARAGINVVLAPEGTIIPTNGLKIKASSIRGVESHGMLCSAAELGLGEDHNGIIEMPACNDNLAKNYAETMGLNDPMIEIAITPNRGDCLGVYGIARDLAAAGLGTLKTLDVPKTKTTGKSPLTITIDATESCPQFIGCYISGVENKASPEWLQKRLLSIGLKPISALVDITNYIAYHLGRPLHVYDADKLDKGLVVRKAKSGEKILALDEEEYSLDEEITVIADAKAPQAIAGIIGGELSKCDLETKNVMLEVALFNGTDVARAGRKLGIHTDSRYRFERYIDPLFLENATHIATQMILDLCGGTASEFIYAGDTPQWKHAITFDAKTTETLTGIPVSKEESDAILTKLGFTVKGNTVNVPSWRQDVEGTADLVEEVTRIYGYDNIPETALPGSRKNFKPTDPLQNRSYAIRHHLVGRGLSEVVTWSFMNQEKATRFYPESNNVTLANPISQVMDRMRPGLLPNLLDVLAKNISRGFDQLALFEIGPAFSGVEPGEQSAIVAGIRSNQHHRKHPLQQERKVDIFDAKADLFATLAQCGMDSENVQITADAPGYYHPGRSGTIRLGKNALGYFGAIHPSILEQYYDDTKEVVAFELMLDKVPLPKKKQTTKPVLAISDFQHSTRDFAFILDRDIAVGEVLKTAKSCDKQLVKEVIIFDIYEGEHIEPGKKSIAFSVKIQADDHTLSEEELEQLSQKIINEISKRYDANLRG